MALLCFDGGTSRTVAILNRQRAVALNVPLLRAILKSLLAQLWPGADTDLAVYIVATPEITHLNETFLRHRGSTDVITFDYSDPEAGRRALYAEIFVCVDETLTYARRFRATWQSELVRYIVHGVLHLSGYDDQRPATRGRMKRAENQWLRRLASTFDFAQIGPPVWKGRNPKR